MSPQKDVRSLWRRRGYKRPNKKKIINKGNA